jgi:hypothetical protein
MEIEREREREGTNRHQTSMGRQTRKTRQKAKRVAGGSATSCGWQRDMGYMQHVAMWGSEDWDERHPLRPQPPLGREESDERHPYPRAPIPLSPGPNPQLRLSGE